ncbi:hypothetical protein CWB85_16430 [Pseudoalteromonas sp. S1727]|uniref:hypothetical protein n=1 Tax=Pseudoalteromonas sp. S1727 TaxID=2066514 RepID=UPI001108759C|nr:hypothetical protein [Pseudoalteromonas sp. S1727]TMN70081.1 hypothetical protein CWB85_16430 [Pseudoalteromonas sp. S1727]
MAKRIIKFTPIAASVALTLGLTGCGSDNDNNKYTPDPVTVYKGEVSTDFNTQISGKAVKGSLKNAVVSVSTLNDAGESVPVAFRLEATTDANYSAESTTSQADADAKALAMLTAENPADAMTSASGGYSIYLEDDFTGPLYITVSTSKEGDDSMVKCDSFTGCGDYDSAPEMSDVAGMVNNGDSSIDFGEWYKDDLELQVVKFIKAPTTAAASNLRGPSFADGDGTGVKHYFANVTLYTSIAAKMLLDGAKDGSAVSDEAIAAASLKTLVQILGEDAAIKVAALTGDISLGGAVDFSDLGEGDSLDTATMLLVQTAVSLQFISGSGTNGSLAEIISNLSAAVQDGTLTDSDDEIIKNIATELTKAVENTSLIFAAIITGEGIDEAFAQVAENLGIADDPEAIAKLKEKATKAVEELKKQAEDAGIDEDLGEVAKEVVDTLVPCETDCDGDGDGDGEDLEAKLAAELNAQIVTFNNALVQNNETISIGVDKVARVKALGDLGLDTTDQVLTYSENVFALAGTKAALTTLKTELATATVTAQAIVASAAALNDEDYSQLKSDAAALQTAIQTQVDAVNTLITGIEAEETRSDEAVAALGLAIEVAKNNVTTATEELVSAKDAVSVTQSSLEVALIAVEAAMVDTKENAELALNSAEEAITAANMAVASAETLTLAANQATLAANALLAIASEQADKDLANNLLTSATDNTNFAETVTTEAASALNTAATLKASAQSTIEKYELLVEVKAGTSTVENATLVTKTGGQALFDTAEIIYDVLTEAWDLGEEGTDVVSTRYPDWTYSFDKNELVLDLVNTQTNEMITVSGSANNKALVFAFGGMIETVDGAKVHIETLADMELALDNCVEANNGQINKDASDSCLVINFEDKITADTAIDGKVLSVDGWSRVEIVDGDSGFIGTLSITGADITELATITAKGVTSEVDFTANLSLNWANEDDIYAVDVELHNGTGYKLSLMAEEGEDFMGSVDANFAGAMMKFGTVTEITNGISVEYIDGEVIEYTDITFLDSSK